MSELSRNTSDHSYDNRSGRFGRIVKIILQAVLIGITCGLIAALLEVLMLTITSAVAQAKQTYIDALLLNIPALTGIVLVVAIATYLLGRSPVRLALLAGIAMIFIILGIAGYQQIWLGKMAMAPDNQLRFIFIILIPLLSLGIAYLLAKGALGLGARLNERQNITHLSRRWFLSWLFKAAGVAAAIGFTTDRHIFSREAEPVQTSISGNTPNVILITIDTLRGDYIGADGKVSIQTPVLDKLASEGVRFTRAFANQPQTDPNHVTIMTGLSPAKHHVRAHMVDVLDPSIPTLASTLRNNGYYTAAFYSWTSLEPAFCGLDHGFKLYEEHTVNQPKLLQRQEGQALAAFYRRASDRLALGELAESILHQRQEVQTMIDGKADVTTDAVLKWLDASSESKQPWFTWIHYFDPHYPYTPPEPYDQMYDPNYSGPVDGSEDSIVKFIQKQYTKPEDLNHLKALYKGEITFTDAQIGRLLDWLDSHQQRENTVVIVTSDHGESFGDFGWFEHGWDVHTPAIRVPLIIRYPNVVPANRVVASNVASLDIMPTILDLLKVQIPDGVEGKSLRSLFTAEDSSRTVYAQIHNDTLMAVTQDRWALVRNMATGQKELYDLQADLGETTNLADKYPDQAAKLEQQLLDWVHAHANH